MERFLSTLIGGSFSCGGNLSWVTIGIDCVLLDVLIPISCVEKFTWELVEKFERSWPFCTLGGPAIVLSCSSNTGEFVLRTGV